MKIEEHVDVDEYLDFPYSVLSMFGRSFKNMATLIDINCDTKIASSIQRKSNSIEHNKNLIRSSCYGSYFRTTSDYQICSFHYARIVI